MISIEKTKTLIKILQEKLKHTKPISGLKRASIPIDIHTTTFQELLSQIVCTEKGYIKSLKLCRETIFIGRAIEFKSTLPMLDSVQAKIIELIQDTSCNIYGGTAFLSIDTTKDDSWRGIDESEYIVPYIEIIKENKGVTLHCNWPHQLDNQLHIQEKILCECLRLNTKKNGRYDKPFSISHDKDFPGFFEWKSQVNHSLETIDSHDIEKIVLAKQVRFKLDHPTDVTRLVTKMTQKEPDCSIYFQQFSSALYFLSVTPETLFLREGNHISVDVIAGTQPVDADNKQDVLLLNNKKNIHEHKFVYHYVLKRLQKIASNICSSKTSTILKLAYVQHIKRVVTATLLSDITDFDVLRCLHPTPAVAGHPTAKALELIAKKEPFNRGWYAGAVGMLGKQKTELLVGIRSCLIRDRSLTVFTGAGIVQGSTPEQEWEELLAKTKSYMAVSEG